MEIKILHLSPDIISPDYKHIMVSFSCFILTVCRPHIFHTAKFMKQKG